MADGVSTWQHSTEKFFRPSAAACLIATAVGGVVVSKPMAKNTTCLSGFFLRQQHRIGARINHADVATARLGFHQRQAVRSRHAQAVTVSAQHHALLDGQPDRLIDPTDRQHADRATRTVDHLDVGRQQVGYAVTRNSMGVAAAKLHEMVVARWVGFTANGLGQPFGDLAVAKFVDVFSSVHGRIVGGESRITKFGE